MEIQENTVFEMCVKGSQFTGASGFKSMDTPNLYSWPRSNSEITVLYFRHTLRALRFCVYMCVCVFTCACIYMYTFYHYYDILLRSSLIRRSIFLYMRKIIFSTDASYFNTGRILQSSHSAQHHIVFLQIVTYS